MRGNVFSGIYSYAYIILNNKENAESFGKVSGKFRILNMNIGMRAEKERQEDS